MRTPDVIALFDYNEWATCQILDTVDAIPIEEFVAPTTITWRNVRGTLVHALDVEQSWRRRLQGEDPAIWQAELPVDAYPTLTALRDDWLRDAAETRAWLAGLDDDTLASVIELDERNRFPLWYFLVHIVTHGIEQRRDVAILLKNYGHDAPELEYLWFADSQHGNA